MIRADWSAENCHALGLSELVDALAWSGASQPARYGCELVLSWDALNARGAGLLSRWDISWRSVFGTTGDYADALSAKMGHPVVVHSQPLVRGIPPNPASEIWRPPSGERYLLPKGRWRTKGDPSLSFRRPVQDRDLQSVVSRQRILCHFELTGELEPSARLDLDAAAAVSRRSSGASNPYHRLRLLAHTAARHSARSGPLDHERATSCLYRVNRALRNLQRQAPSVAPASDGVHGEPWIEAEPDAARMCVQLLSVAENDAAARAVEGDAMVLLGAIMVAVRQTRQCAVCFRWSQPGWAHCGRHSLRASEGSSSNQRQCVYAADRRALARVTGLGPDRERPVYWAHQRPAHMWLARELWPGAPLPGDDLVAPALLSRLAAAPALCAYLGLDAMRLSVSTVLEELRSKVDPLVGQAGEWEEILEDAELFRSEPQPLRARASTPLRKGTIDLIYKAQELLRLHGKLSQAKLAAMMNKRPSALSHLLSRHSGDTAVEKLRRALRA